MTTTAGRPAADTFPDGFLQDGCRICGRLAGGDYDHAGGYWQIAADTALWFPGGEPGHYVAVPAAHSASILGDDFAQYKIAGVYGWLAGFAGQVAIARGLTEYDLLISVENGHPYAEIRPRRPARGGVFGWASRINLGPARKSGMTCWGLRPGSTANGIANLAWFAALLASLIAFAAWI
jgi:hypothetical protein